MNQSKSPSHQKHQSSWVGKALMDGENCKDHKRIVNKKWHSEKKETISSLGLGQNGRVGGSHIRKFLRYV